MPGLRRFDESRLVAHEVHAARSLEAARFGQVHRCRLATLLERAEERIDELPVAQTTGYACAGYEDGCEERIREFSTAHARRKDRLRFVERLRGRFVDDENVIDVEFLATREQHVAAEFLSRRRNGSVGVEQSAERLVFGERFHHDHRKTVEALVDFFAILLRNRLVFGHSLLLFTDKQSGSVKLRAV